MRGGTAHVQVPDWHAVLAAAGEWPVEEQLIQGQFALENVAFRQADLLFDFAGGAHFHVDDEVLEAGAVALDLIYHGLAEPLPLFRRPRAIGQLRGAVLHEIRHPVLAGRRHGRVPGGGDDGLDERILRPSPPLPAIVGPLQGFERAVERLPAAIEVGVVRHAGELRQAGKRDVHLAGRAANLEVAGLSMQALRQVAFLHDAREGALRIQVGNHHPRSNFIAVFQHDAGRPAVFHQHLAHRGVGFDGAAMLGHSASEGVGDGAHAAPSQAPGADAAIHIAHDMMQQNVGGTWRIDAQRRADDAGGGHRRLDQAVLEIVFQKFGGAHGEEADVFVDLPFAQGPELLGQIEKLHDVAGPEGCRVRRGAQQSLANQLGIAREIRLKAVHGIRVMGRMALQFQIGRLLVLIGEQPLVPVAETDGSKVGHQNQTVPAQVQIPMNRLAHHAAYIGAVGIDPALAQFPGNRGAADVVVLFQHQDFEPRLGQIGGIGQAVVPGADHDGVAAVHLAAPRPRMACAALCPGAPVRSPPGWQPAPHRCRPRIGVSYWAAS